MLRNRSCDVCLPKNPYLSGWPPAALCRHQVCAKDGVLPAEYQRDGAGGRSIAGRPVFGVQVPGGDLIPSSLLTTAGGQGWALAARRSHAVCRLASFCGPVFLTPEPAWRACGRNLRWAENRQHTCLLMF